MSASLALLVGVTAEFVVGLGGIGAYMEQQQLAFQLPELYAAVSSVGLLGYAVNAGLRAAERRVVFWGGRSEGRRQAAALVRAAAAARLAVFPLALALWEVWARTEASFLRSAGERGARDGLGRLAEQ